MDRRGSLAFSAAGGILGSKPRVTAALRQRRRKAYEKRIFRVDTDGFNGAWYPAAVPASREIIVMLGDSAEDCMAATGAAWLNGQGIHVMAMSPDKKDYGHHSYPLERF